MVCRVFGSKRLLASAPTLTCPELKDFNKIVSSMWVICKSVLTMLVCSTRMLFKGLIMDKSVVLTSTPEWVVSPRRAIALGRSPCDRPAARQPTRELMSTTHTYPWLIPIITWCWQFTSLSTNILLIKSKLKLESRAIVVGVAMSPRYLGGKYRCRPHPRWRKCTRQFFFFPGTRACQSNCIRVASSLAWRQRHRSYGV